MQVYESKVCVAKYKTELCGKHFLFTLQSVYNILFLSEEKHKYSSNAYNITFSRYYRPFKSLRRQ